MANPEPEIRPELAKEARPDCLIGTGRSDYPNQVNNSLCFPFIFRGALDCGAITINEEMKLAAVRALAELAQRRAVRNRRARVRRADAALRPRLPDPARVRSAAHHQHRAGGRARRRWTAASRRGRSPISTPIAISLTQFVYQSGTPMQPVFAAAKRAPKRVVYAEGEDERVLRAAQVAVDEGHRAPGAASAAPDVIAARIEKLGLRLTPRQGLRRRQHPRRSALSATTGTSTTSSTRRKGVSRAAGAGGDAQPPHADRRDAGAPAATPTRCCAARVGNYADHLRVRAQRDRPARRREDAGRDADADPARAPALHLRHARQPRPERRADRRDDAARRGGGAALRREAERRAAVALELRQLRRAVGA